MSFKPSGNRLVPRLSLSEKSGKPTSSIAVRNADIIEDMNRPSLACLSLLLLACGSDDIAPSADGGPRPDAGLQPDARPGNTADAAVDFVNTSGTVEGARLNQENANLTGATIRAVGAGSDKVVTASGANAAFTVETPQGAVTLLRTSFTSAVDYFPNLREVIAPVDMDVGVITLIDREFWDDVTVATLGFPQRDTAKGAVIVDILYEGGTPLTNTRVTLTDSTGSVANAFRVSTGGTPSAGNTLLADSQQLIGFHNVTAGTVSVAITDAPASLLCVQGYAVDNYTVEGNVLTNISMLCGQGL